MPNVDAPGSLLRGGEFYSPVEGVLRTDDILLSELRQRSARKVPRHEHELAYFTVVLDGDYLEGDRVMEELSPFTAAFNPSGVSHSTVVGPAGAAFFTVELRNLLLQPLDLRLPAETMVDRGAGPILWPGLRLYSAFKTRTADPLLLESHVLEMLGAISKVEPVEKTVPRWFVRVKERLHQDFREALRMRDLARDAGVHPVHLARMFRAREKRTPGDYLQGLRVRAACDLLRNREWPLAAIAADCGFADQSHFTRVFRRLAGTTPAQFRRALGA